MQFSWMCAVLAMCAFTATCTKKVDTGTAGDVEKSRAPVVIAETIAAKKIFDQLLYPARVEPSTQAVVVADTEGLVQKLNVSLGRSVKKGDVLLYIENTDPVYRYAPVAVSAPVDGVVSFLDANMGTRV